MNMNEYEAYQTARVERFIPADQSFEEYLLAEVNRLREGIRDICDTSADTADDWFGMAVMRLEELIE